MKETIIKVLTYVYLKLKRSFIWVLYAFNLIPDSAIKLKWHNTMSISGFSPSFQEKLAHDLAQLVDQAGLKNFFTYFKIVITAESENTLDQHRQTINFNFGLITYQPTIRIETLSQAILANFKTTLEILKSKSCLR